MNTHEHDDILSDAQRWQLRALRQDNEPERDLWDGIAARIAATPQVPAATPPIGRRRRRGLTVFAAAATLALAVGLGWQLRPEAPVAGPATQPPTLLSIEAETMVSEYEAALSKVEAARGIAQPPPMLAELDASAVLIREALAQAPHSLFLFERLQRVYAQRLALTQRIPLA